MIRCLSFLTPAIVGAVLLAAPVSAQVQSQPLPPPAGASSSPPSAAPPASPPPMAEPPRAPASKPASKQAKGKAPARTTCPAGKVDINDASADTLKTLPQIGGQRSNAIIKARPYAAPEDLVRKKVLKKAVYEKIKPCILASGIAPSPTTPSNAKRPKSSAAKPPTTTARAPVSTGPATPVPIPSPTEPSAKPQQ